MANIQNVKFYRNATPLASYEAAAADIKTRGTQEKEGTLILSRYTESNVSKTIAGLVNVDGSVTIVTTEYSIIPASQVSVADSGGVFEGTNVEAVLAEIAEKIDAATVDSADKTVVVTSSNSGTDLAVNIDGKTIVKETTAGATQGQLKADLQLVQLTSAEVTALSDNNVKDAYKLIYSTDSNRAAIGGVVKIYKDSSLQEVYLGASTDTINAQTGVITKNTVTDPQSMNFAYQLADGTYSLTKIDVSKFLTESEFGDGLIVSGAGVVSVNAGDGLEFDSSDPKKVQAKVGDGLEIDSTSKAIEVKVDSSSEAVTTASGVTSPVLSVSSSGVKVDNIQDAIDYAVGQLDDVAVKSGTVNGVAGTGTVTNNNLDLTVAGNNVPLTGYTALTPTGNAQETVTIAATDTTNQAFAKVEKAINVNEAVVAAALNDLDSTKVDVISVNGVQSKTPATGDIVASVTIDGGDVELTGYTKPAATSAIAATDTVNEAIGKLEKGLESAVSGGLTGVSVNNVALTPSSNSVNVAIAGATTAATATGNEAIVVTTDSSTGAVTLGLAVLDAGTY